MKTLFVVRHAKSSWKFEELSDVDRPLKGRGIRDAKTVADYLAENDVKPDVVYSSPATRALHTALIFCRRLGYPFAEIQIRDSLYMTKVSDMIEVVKSAPDQADTIMLFGHNPTITNFINKLADQKIGHMPTTGMVSLQFDIEKWSEMDGNAEIAMFEYPKKKR
jgi:phosphohistidine phosphatase